MTDKINQDSSKDGRIVGRKMCSLLGAFLIYYSEREGEKGKK